MAQSFKLFFQAVYTEWALKAICFSLQFYYLEVLNQDGTPSRATAMTPPPLSAKGSFVRIDPAVWMISPDNYKPKTPI